MILADFLRELFLSPVLVLLVLVALFAALSYWSLSILREYPGYALGWLVGLFFVVVYVSLGTAPDPDTNRNVTLNVFQVICPGLVGILLGGILMLVLRLGNSYSAMRGLKVAGMTALGVVLLFLMFMVNVATQRMIGIFALAFCIAALGGVVVFRGTAAAGMFNAQAAPPPPPGTPPISTGHSTLDRIREQMQNRNRR
ncbi:MAG: hypothetical protein MUE40_14985 [Anaerolineae bacterium]|nr:hypothetical protein [Anaerolineae bacterium]